MNPVGTGYPWGAAKVNSSEYVYATQVQEFKEFLLTRRRPTPSPPRNSRPRRSLYGVRICQGQNSLARVNWKTTSMSNVPVWSTLQTGSYTIRRLRIHSQQRGTVDCHRRNSRLSAQAPRHNRMTNWTCRA